MKKLKLIVPALVVLFWSFGSSAQTFSLDKDSSKMWWKSPVASMDIHIKAKNETSSPSQMTWKFTDHHTDPNWTFLGGCDNVGCYIYSTNVNTTDFVASGKDCDFKFSYNGDAGAFDSKSYSTIEITSGTTIKNATFIAYKTKAVGISNTILQDNDIAVFPNPAQNYIDVVYNPSSDVKTIAIYNLIGKVVSVYKVTDKSSARCEFNAEMPSGIYVVRVADSKGVVIATRKITRQ